MELFDDVSVVLGIIEDLSALNILQAADRLKQLLLAVSGDTRDAEDLAGVGSKGDVLEDMISLVIADIETAHFNASLHVLRLGAVDVERYFLSDHHLCQGFLRRVAGIDCADIFAFPKNAYSV